MTTIALDAMGGDHAPRAEVEGAILAARELGVRILQAKRKFHELQKADSDLLFAFTSQR